MPKRIVLAEAWKRSWSITECVGCGKTFTSRGKPRKCPFCGYKYGQGWTKTVSVTHSCRNDRLPGLRTLIRSKECQQILDIIVKNGPITTTEIAKRVGMTNPKVLTRLNVLVKEGKVKIVGKKDKTFLWEVAECVEH